jgi:hypothetical protein
MLGLTFGLGAPKVSGYIVLFNVRAASSNSPPLHPSFRNLPSKKTVGKFLL